MTARRKILTGAGALAVSVMLAGCAEKTEAVPEPVVEPIAVQTPAEQEAQPTPEGEDDQTIGERESVDGKMQSYLTGEWKDEEVVNRRPIAVMIPNNSPAMPQYGISRASII